MPESLFSGAKKLRFQNAGGDWSAATELIIKSDSESSPEQPSDDETSSGDILFAGEYENETINVYSMEHYDALRAKMIADERIDLQQQDMGENWNDIALDFIPRVRKPRNYATGARRFFVLAVRKFHID